MTFILKGTHAKEWEWWRARRDLNPRPQPPQGCALSMLSYERAIRRPTFAFGGGPGTQPLRLRRTLSILSYGRAAMVVPKVGLEPTRPCGHYALNVARLPFRHFGAC